MRCSDSRSAKSRETR